MSDPVTLFHRARAAGILFRESPEGWIADCSPELWEKWQPAFVEHWPEVLRSLRPALASNRQATSSVIRISPEAWSEAGQAIERAKLTAISNRAVEAPGCIKSPAVISTP